MKSCKKFFLTSICFSLCLLTPFIYGCKEGDLVTNSYKALAVSKNIYEAIYQSFGEAYKEGLIDEKQKDLLIKQGNKFYDAYQIALDVLEHYQSIPDNDSKKEELRVLILRSVATAVYRIDKVRNLAEYLLGGKLVILPKVPVEEELKPYLEEVLKEEESSS